MRIFLTGGTGFIGRHTLEELKRRGHRLLVLSRHGGEGKGTNFIQGDLADIARWQSRLKKFKPEAAVHLAWEGIPDFSYERSEKNLREGLALFSVLAEAGCKKIIAAGSAYEYGNLGGKVREETRGEPLNAIAAAKQSLRLMGEALAKEKEMDFIWLRPLNPYGNGQRPGSLIPYVLRRLEEGAPLRLKNPLVRGDFIYVEDVARAFADAVSRGKGIAAYSVGSGKLVSARDVANTVCKAMEVDEKHRRDFLRSAQGRPSGGMYADLGRIRRDIGWRPTTDLKTGIKKTLKTQNA